MLARSTDSCAGAQVRAGDVIVACEDGVLALPQSRIDDIIYQVDDIEPIEAAVQQAIAARAPLAEIEALIKRKKQRRDDFTWICGLGGVRFHVNKSLCPQAFPQRSRLVRVGW